MNNLTIQSELTLAGILTMYLYYYYLRSLSNKKTGDPFPDRQLLTSPPKINYKNNPIPIINNNPAIIIRGAICSSSIGFLFMCDSWGNRVPFGILLFTLFVGKLEQFLSYLVAPHSAAWRLIPLHIIREIYLDQ